MGKINKLMIYAFRQPTVVLAYIWQKFSPIIPPKLYLHIMFRLRMGYWMNFKNPKTFNEKLQWLKLYDRKPEYIQMVDKVEAKKYVAKIIGEEYIIPTLAVYDSVEDINFDVLPSQFVLKCTHDSGGLVICKNKNNFDVKAAKEKLKKNFVRNFYYVGREWPYKYVRKHIMAEQYISETKHDLQGIKDYKFFCFSGKVKFFKVDYGRFTEHHANYYSPTGEFLKFGERSYLFKENVSIDLPPNLDVMIELAEKLAVNIPFIRVDLYNCMGKILFGELTFYPASGFGMFNPKEQDALIGKLLKIN